MLKGDLNMNTKKMPTKRNANKRKIRRVWYFKPHYRKDK